MVTDDEDESDVAGTDGDAGAAAPTGSTRSVGDILGEPTAKQYVKFNVGVFAAIGVGFAVALFLLDALADSGGGTAGAGSAGMGGEMVLLGLVLVFLMAPLIAGITGSITSLRYDDEEKAVATVASAGAFLGYLAILFLTIIAASLVTDAGSGGLTDELLSLIGFGVGVAVAGGGAAVVTERFA